jgi:hypothetical protein
MDVLSTYNAAIKFIYYIKIGVTMAPLKPGDIVWSKSKPHRKGTINAANNEGRKHEWIVQFEGTVATETLRSQQLLPKGSQ